MSYFNPPYVIVALDNLDATAAIKLAKKLDPKQCRLKVGKELFTAYGPEFIKKLMRLKFEIFLDMKFHDIPNTVSKACIVAANLGVWMISVHVLGGAAMLKAARETVDQLSGHKPLLIGVTLLTSLEPSDLLALGFHRKMEDQVVLLAKLAHQVGLDGAVCSPKEVSVLRDHVGEKFCLVTPGIRFSDSSRDDQKRYMAPKEAFLAGSDYLVIGRPITQAKHPAKVLEEISAMLNSISGN